jgi:hypothetical protein
MTGYHRSGGRDEFDDQSTRPLHSTHRAPVERYDEYDDRIIAETEAHRRRVIYGKISNIVWSITGFILGLIGVRVLLRMIAADDANPFVALVYSWSEFFVRPFLGIVQDPQSDGAVLEINSLIAMLIYVLITYAVLRLVWVVLDVTTPSEPPPPP